MYIYKIINNKTNKIYVGQTKHPIEKRWKEHIHAYKYGVKYKKHIKNSAIYSAMRKYELTSFQIIEIEKCNNIDELNQREIYWIKELNTLSPNGYNLTTGGERPSYSPEVIEKLRIAGKRNAKTTPELLEHFKKGYRLKQQVLYRTDIKTNEVKIYNSLYEAGLDGFNRKTLSRAIHTRTGFHKGYNWAYENKIPRTQIKNPQIKVVLCYDLTGIFLKKYETMSSVKNDGFNISTVSRCCNGKLKNYKNRIFKFEE